MRFEIDIEYSPDQMRQAQRRLTARTRGQYYDRVPVSFCLEPRYFAHAAGMDYAEFFTDVETQYRLQLEFAKTRIETIPEDFCTEPAVVVRPYFDNVVVPNAFGAAVHWARNDVPQTIPMLQHPDDITSLAVPEPDAGLWGKVLRWHEQMTHLAQQTKVTFAGQPGRVEVAPIQYGSGPHMVAVDLAGGAFYEWMIAYPQLCHQLLDKITAGISRAERHLRKLDPRPRNGYGLAEDAAQMVSAEMFREFVVPYDNRLYDEFGRDRPDGRGMHMCGDSQHLHEALVNDLHITSFNLFGYRVEPAVVAANLGGKCLLWGNIDPMLMLQGAKQQVTAAAREALRWLAPAGGFMLGDGANVCPGTPIENLAALIEAAQDYGLPPDRAEVEQTRGS